MPVCFVASAQPPSVSPWSEGQPCAGVVLVEPADVPPNPFYLTLAEGSLLSAAVGAVWITAWCFRALVRALHVDGASTEGENP